MRVIDVSGLPQAALYGPVLKAEIVHADLSAERASIESARKNSEAEGYEAGYTAGVAAAEARLLEFMSRIQAWQAQMEDTLVDLSCDIVQSLLGRRSGRRVLYDLAADVLKRMEPGTALTLALSSTDATGMASKLDRLVTRFAAVEGWVIDDAIFPGTLEIRQAGTVYPVSLSRRMREVRDVLMTADQRQSDLDALLRQEQDEVGGVDG